MPSALDLGRIRSEVDKLVLYAAGESTITAAHVRDVVMPVDDSSGVFALIDFLKSGNAAAAAREVEALFESGSPGPMILGLIRTAAGQLRPDARARAGAVGGARRRPGAQDVARRAALRAGAARRGVVRQRAGAPGGPAGSAIRPSWP